MNRINKKINKKDKNLRAKEYFQKKNMESMRKRNNFLMNLMGKILMTTISKEMSGISGI